MTEFITNNGMYLLYFGGVIVIAIVVLVVQMKIRKNRAEKFLQETPDAAKVFLTSKALITSEAVTVHLVNDEKPVMFTEKGKAGFYVKPKQADVHISYTYTRPGVMYKTVTQSTGMIKKEIEVEPNKSYKLSYDRKKSQFIFEEM